MVARIMCMISLWVICAHECAHAQASQQQEELPLSAKATIKEMERTIQQAKERAAEKLKSIMKSEMQAGNLARANLINQAIQNIGVGADKRAPEGSAEEIVGKWTRRDGVTCQFNKNNEMSVLDNGWGGPWKVEGGRLSVTLSKCGSRVVEDPRVLTYKLPVKKDLGGKKVTVMEAEDEKMNLYREP